MRRTVVRAAGIGAVAAGLVGAAAGAANASSAAGGAAVGSPGAVSGWQVQAPVHVPVNFCGNTINVIGLLNPTFGNVCANG
ncbi:chaplin [Mangrovactinospora gilvigrisea]|uniref:Chaplin n=1 Tax=Mangrovactinospora gilvigrisea TaxID=1428644 RepID=A0A1J7BEM8_9ACTN|nr:chaplin [Mangrovactinospora gilvigrisea]OIV37139.1 chaplin [Mangrovactinospora gilvigrisea]